MRIKFLAVIVSSLILSLAVMSCLGDPDTIEYPSDDTIHAFEIDKIYGVNYKFSIDQVNRMIFNQDSVPVSADTIINRILGKKIETVGGAYVMSGDSMFVMTDSVDFSTSMTSPVKIKVIAPDGAHSREYTIKVLRHLQDPDSLVWRKRADSFAGAPVSRLKTVILDDKLITFTSAATAYRSSLKDGQDWEQISVYGLPTTIKLHTITAYKDRLYAVAEDGSVFNTTTDERQWEESSALSGDVVALLAAFPDQLTGIIKEGGVSKFCVTNNTMTGWETGDNVSADFPVDNVSSTVFMTNTATTLYKSIVVGKNVNSSSKETTPWFSLEGKRWEDLSTTTDYQLPAMNRPSIIHYNDKLYAFGEKLDSLYTSEEGIVWKKIKEKVMFPKEMTGTGDYSMVVDKDHFIWIIQSKGTVWRGRINRLSSEVK